MRIHGFGWTLRSVLVPAGLLIGCGDDAPVGPVLPCAEGCVTSFRINFENLILTTDDTVRLSADPVTLDGYHLTTDWSVWFGPLRVDSTGLVTTVAAGRGVVLGRARGSTYPPSSLAYSEIWVVHPDTSAQPFVATFRNAATGDTLARREGFKGVDSIDVTVSYVIGNLTQTVGPPALTFEIRSWVVQGLGNVLSSTTIPLTVRGKGAFVTFRVNLTERTSNGSRRFPSNFYSFFVLLPLADGRLLGQETGYTVSF